MALGDICSLSLPGDWFGLWASGPGTSGAYSTAMVGKARERGTCNTGISRARCRWVVVVPRFARRRTDDPVPARAWRSIVRGIRTNCSAPAPCGFRMLLVDFLGFGFSEQPLEYAYTMEDHADSVAELLRQLSVGSAHVVGHSMGGPVAIALAMRHPDLVGSLVVAEGNLHPGSGTARAVPDHRRITEPATPTNVTADSPPASHLARRSCPLQGGTESTCVSVR